MESSLTPEDAAAALRGADSTRDRLAGQIRLPRGFHAWSAIAIAIQIGSAAFGVAAQSLAGAVTVGGGAVLFLVVAFAQVRAFRRLNGVRLGGLTSRVVLGTSAGASLAYGLGLGAALWAAYAGIAALVVLSAAAGGVGYAASGVHWMRAYRHDPVRHGRGESTLVMVAMAVPFLVAIVLLVIEH